ncbi:MAG: ABC transporter ATP-binding protein [Candidatus Latescibacteria bacterium]|jgi:ABC-type multidrug transport system fused ATPase/permease subunit|nr:ABC transporter ATP-binding protein [Candidatus Latescibacterota bacterium]
MGVLKRVWKFIRPFRGRLLIAICLTGSMTLLGMLPPILMKHVIDDVVGLGQWGDAGAICLAFLSVNVLAAAGTYWNYLIIYLVGQRLVFDIRLALFRHIQELSLRFYDQMGTGKIMARIMGDVSRIQNMVTWNTISIVNDLISFVFGLVMIFYFSWQLSLITLALLPLYVVNYMWFVKRIRRKNVTVWKKMDRVANALQERLKGTRLVRAFTNEDREAAAFADGTRSVLNTAIETTTLSASFSGTSGLLSGLGQTVIYCLGCYYVIVGQMTYGEVAAFSAFVFRVLSPAVRFTEVSNLLEQTSISVERIFEVLDTEPEIVERPNAQALAKVQGHVHFRNVHFSYVPGEPVLQGVDLEVPAGSTVALVGHTGCGKTTLTSLLMRFYDVTEGAIEVDGVDIRDVTLRSLRRNIGAVLQESILFHTSIYENLKYGDRQAKPMQVIEAARAAEVNDFVLDQEDGYDTVVGEGGIVLSVGEKQRLAIARAILTQPGIMILDEATSSLDSRSEALIQKALTRVMQGRTSFIIAHRLATIVNADMIVVMDKGKIKEVGSHEELLALPNGDYRQLYEEQFAAQLETV